jgi:hypothetical protein
MPRKSKRSLAALKGWRTRRANARARSLAAKKGWRTRREKERSRKPGKTLVRNRTTVPRDAKDSGNIFSHLVSLDLKPSRGKSYGKRDFIIPAPRGASFTTLRKIAQETLTGPERQLLQFFRKENVTISEGPSTRARKAQLR